MTAEPLASTTLGPPRSGRILDKGAVFAGWIGLGMAFVIAIAFELIVAVQSLVFIAAPLAGFIIGGYANTRSARWRPRLRVVLNAAYAGLVSGVALAVLYVTLRLLFVFADSGSLPDGSTMACQAGPDCTYQRYLRPYGPDDVEAARQRAADLAAAGVTDGASFGSLVIREQLNGGAIIVVLTLAGALAAAAVRAVRTPPQAGKA